MQELECLQDHLDDLAVECRDIVGNLTELESEVSDLWLRDYGHPVRGLSSFLSPALSLPLRVPIPFVGFTEKYIVLLPEPLFSSPEKYARHLALWFSSKIRIITVIRPIFFLPFKKR